MGPGPEQGSKKEDGRELGMMLRFLWDVLGRKLWPSERGYVAFGTLLHGYSRVTWI